MILDILSLVSSTDGLIFCERIVLFDYSFIIAKRTHRQREELSPLVSLYHMGNNLRHRQLIFFFSILFIEDTVFFATKTDTSEAVMTISHEVTIVTFLDISPEIERTETMIVDT